MTSNRTPLLDRVREPKDLRGFDVAELITHAGTSGALDIDTFAREWGIDFKNHPRGGVTGVVPQVAKSEREVVLMQRKADAPPPPPTHASLPIAVRGGGCAGGPSHSRPGPAPTRWHRPSAGQKPAAGLFSLNEKQVPIKPRN